MLKLFHTAPRLSLHSVCMLCVGAYVHGISLFHVSVNIGIILKCVYTYSNIESSFLFQNFWHLYWKYATLTTHETYIQIKNKKCIQTKEPLFSNSKSLVKQGRQWSAVQQGFRPLSQSIYSLRSQFFDKGYGYKRPQLIFSLGARVKLFKRVKPNTSTLLSAALVVSWRPWGWVIIAMMFLQ